VKPQVLVVDDDHPTRELLKLSLGAEGFDVATSASWADALERFSAQDFDVVLTDLNLGGPNGIDLCQRLAEDRPDTPVIVITAFGSLDTAISAMRAGAYDFLTKPFESESVVVALTRALRHRELTREVRRLRANASSIGGFGGLLGSSPAMTQLYKLLNRVAASDASVLVQGESGTGKEMVARALHDRGARRGKAFVAINCAALPDHLLESELFGHARGAFTDAKEARPGLFVEADAGTLFFDEVGDLPLGLQPKLLRALEQRSVRPLGSKAEVPFDVRVVAASHRNLEQAIEEGSFREDLYYRLNVISVTLPPLRVRGSDVLLLAQHFLEQFTAERSVKVTGIARGAADKLLKYPWPGNVRELRNCIERAVALTAYDKIAPEDLPEKIRNGHATQVDGATELVPLDEVERRHIFQVLAACKGNRSQAAQILGLNRKTLYRKLHEYEHDGR
jgi:two-component system response regulator HydG